MIYVKILEWLRQGCKFMELFNKIPSSSPNLISEPIGLNIAQCFQSRLQSSNGCHPRWRPSLTGSWLWGPGLCNIAIFAASRATNLKTASQSPKISNPKPSLSSVALLMKICLRLLVHFSSQAIVSIGLV